MAGSPELSIAYNDDATLTITAAQLLEGSSDPDGDDALLSVEDLTVVAVPGEDEGTVADNGNGTWTYTPPVDWDGTVEFAYGVGDLDLTTTTTASVTLDTEVLQVGDVQAGTPDGEVIVGTSGDDTLAGSDGDDIIFAGDGDDIVAAGGGDDTIIGGSGRGNDIYDGGAGIDTVTYTSAVDSIEVNLTAGTASGVDIDSDRLSGIENVVGGLGGDTLIGDDEDNVLDGGADGDDTLEGRGGDDLLVGGAGDDTAVFTGDFSDYDFQLFDDGTIIVTDTEGDDGEDTLIGIESLRFADQTVAAADLADLLNQTPDPAPLPDPEPDPDPEPEPEPGPTPTPGDLIIGTAGDDDIVGTSGDDLIFGGAGDDLIFGDPELGDSEGGDDEIAISPVGGNDFIDGGADSDTIDGGPGDDTILGGEGLTEFSSTDTFSFAEGGFSSVSTYSEGYGYAENSLAGGAGDDQLFGGDGDNYLFGDGSFGEGGDNDGSQGGDDLLIGGGVFNFDESSSSYTETQVDDFGDVIVTETYSNSSTYSDQWATNELDGGGGDDQLFGGVGDVSIWGGDGDDLLVGSSALNVQSSSYSQSDSRVGVPAEGEDPTLAFAEGSSYESSSSYGDASNVLEGGYDDDIIIGGAGDNSIRGDDGDDVLIGGAVGNYIFESSLDVYSDGSVYSDVYDDIWATQSLSGGRGDDVLVGGRGDNELSGGRGDDVIVGGSLFNETQSAEYWAASAADLEAGVYTEWNVYDDFSASQDITGGRGDDRLIGGVGDNTIHGGQGDDYITGSSDFNTLGESWSEGGESGEISASFAYSELLGGSDDGNDVLIGGVGDNFSEGGDGDDVLTGSTALNTFTATVTGYFGEDETLAVTANYAVSELRGDSGDDVLEPSRHGQLCRQRA